MINIMEQNRFMFFDESSGFPRDAKNRFQQQYIVVNLSHQVIHDGASRWKTQI